MAVRMTENVTMIKKQIDWESLWQAENLLIQAKTVDRLIDLLNKTYRQALGLAEIKLLVFAKGRDSYVTGSTSENASVSDDEIRIAPYHADIHASYLESDLPGGSVANVPLVNYGQSIGLLVLACTKEWPEHQLTRSFLARTAAMIALCLQNIQNQQHLQDVIIRDPLTQLYNRRYYNERLSQELSKASRNDCPICCVYFDIDFFKHINDTFGHAAGDSILYDIGQRASEQLRSSELLARMGGEEFAALIPDASLKTGQVVAERIRRSVEKTPFTLPDGESIQVSVSCGVAKARGSLTDSKNQVDDLIDRSAQAVSDAKALGRNRVVCAKK